MIKKNFARFFVPALIAAVILLLAYPREALKMPARLLYVETPIETRADAIICLSGAEVERVEHCLKLYRQGRSGMVVVTGGALGKGLLFFQEGRSLASLSRDWLASHGMPEKDIAVLVEGMSTYEEAAAVRELAFKKGFKSMIIVSSPYHMRRVSLVFKKAFRNSGVSLGFSPARSFEEGLGEWWRDEGLMISVFQEYLKLIMYAGKGYIL
ncbi:MAG: YdcF family protein [Deltaproteobacteria bacterium]|nr:YdcF family protein [Deltaproteobacteria bacterium]